MEQGLAEIWRENLHIRTTRETRRMTSHHLLIETPDQSLRLIGWTSRLRLVRCLAKSQWRHKQQEKMTPRKIHTAPLGTMIA
jgi:hypothetical protein